MPSAYLQWRFHSGERVVTCGPLVIIPNELCSNKAQSTWKIKLFLVV